MRKEIKREIKKIELEQEKKAQFRLETLGLHFAPAKKSSNCVSRKPRTSRMKTFIPKTEVEKREALERVAKIKAQIAEREAIRF